MVSQSVTDLHSDKLNYKLLQLLELLFATKNLSIELELYLEDDAALLAVNISPPV